MNRINGFFADHETAYDHFVTARGGRALLAKLRIANDIEEKKRKELKNMNRANRE